MYVGQKPQRGGPTSLPFSGASFLRRAQYPLAFRSVPMNVPLRKVFGHSGWMNGDAGSTAEYWMSSTVLPPGGFNPASSRTRFALSWSVHAVSPLRPRPPTMCPREL